MKMYSVVCLSLVMSTALLMADPPVDTRGLPDAVQRTLSQSVGKGGKVEKVLTRRVNGQVVYEVEYKERGSEKTMMIAEDGVVLSDDKTRGGGQGAKGKGKAKGRNKGSDVEDRDIASPQADPAPARPSAAPAARESATAPKVESTTPGVRTPATPPRTEAPSVGTRPVITREMKADFNRRIDRMSKLDNNQRAVAAGVVAIEKETGVARATLQAQMKASGVGLSTLLIANEIARDKGAPVTTVFKERRSGRTWETIAANHRYDMSAVLPKLERVEAAMAKAAKQ